MGGHGYSSTLVCLSVCNFVISESTHGCHSLSIGYTTPKRRIYRVHILRVGVAYLTYTT